MATKDDYQDFKVSLNDLKLNSKPLINHLTFLAEKKVHNASQIVRAIEERIIEVSRSAATPELTPRLFSLGRGRTCAPRVVCPRLHCEEPTFVDLRATV
jgi:hypothetical protein